MITLLPALADTGQTSVSEAILFWVLAPVVVLGALGVLVTRKAVHAALSGIVVMITLAFMYVAQDAPFLGVVQVVVYTGAIMMLFLFVLMLVGVDAADSPSEILRGHRTVAVTAAVGLLVVLAGVIGTAVYGAPVGLTQTDAQTNPEGLAELVFGQHVFALEVVGALLVTAAVGALVLTHRERLLPASDQRARVEERMRRLGAGEVITPLPAPGVYARHNGMDVPALGPDGQPVESSVNRVLKIRGQEADSSAYAARVDRVLTGGWADDAADGRTSTAPTTVPPDDAAASTSEEEDQ